MRKSMFVFSVLMILSMLLTSCGTAATTPNAVAPADTQAAPAVADTAAPAANAAPTAVPSPTIQPPTLTGGEGCDPGATQVTWFVGLGSGTHPEDIVLEKAWVDKYNKSQKDACVILNVVPNTGSNSYDALRAMVAGGNAPDIVGPVGKAGRASFQGSWADIKPLADKAGYDLSKYDPQLLDFTKDEGVLVGIPFALFPSFIYYNKKLFDEAQLPYPPHKVGDLYNGKPWDLANFQDLAMKLTVDKAGNDATSEGDDWKISSARADAARAMLQGGGLTSDRIYEVAGKAGSEPMLPEDPSASANRRLSIVLLKEAPPAPPGKTL